MFCPCFSPSNSILICHQLILPNQIYLAPYRNWKSLSLSQFRSPSILFSAQYLLRSSERQAGRWQPGKVNPSQAQHKNYYENSTDIYLTL